MAQDLDPVGTVRGDRFDLRIFDHGAAEIHQLAVDAGRNRSHTVAELLQHLAGAGARLDGVLGSVNRDPNFRTHRNDMAVAGRQSIQSGRRPQKAPKPKLVGTDGIEPSTPSASGKCSPAELRA
jgi:hypothetical protein